MRISGKLQSGVSRYWYEGCILLGLALFCFSAIVDSFWSYGVISLLSTCALVLLMSLSLMRRKVFIVGSVLVACIVEQLTEVTGLGLLCLLFCSLLAWGYLRQGTFPSVLLPLCASALLIGLYHYHLGFGSVDYTGSFLYFLICFTPWVIGTSLQRRDSENETLQLQARLQAAQQDLDRKNRDASLAKMLHDSVTGDLSLIMLLSNENDARDEETDNLIFSLSREALEKLHAAIDVIEGRSSPYHTQNIEGDVNYLRQLCREKDKQMNAAGCCGRTIVLGDEAALVPRECIELIQELYANIIRHCAGLPYNFVIKISSKGVRIIQSNEYADVSGSSISKGRGLSLHKQAIEKRGGTLHVNQVEDSWLVNTWIPIAGKSALSDEGLQEVNGGASVIDYFRKYLKLR